MRGVPQISNTRKKRISKISWLILPVAAIVALLIFYHIPKKEKPLTQEQVDRVNEILKDMTLEEKVGQVIIAYFTGPEFADRLVAELCELPLGGIILYTSSGNIGSPAQVAALTKTIQKGVIDSGVLPLFISIDQEGGSVVRLTEGVTVFPGNMAMGATGNTELAGQSAAVTARELRLVGINFNFAPVVDVNNNPDNPVIGLRSFGSDPEAVARLGVAMVKPYLKEGVLATAKHFPGHGDTDVDSHYGLPFIPYDLDRLKNIELKPFQSMIKEGVPAVMMAHILVPGLTGNNGLPVSLSAQAVDYLRDKMGFEGLVITDSMSMGAITGHWGLGEAAVMAFQAGVDLVLFGPWTGVQPGDRKVIYNSLLQAVEDGTITEGRLDQSVRRILAAKLKYRIIDDPLPHSDSLSDLASPQNLEVARRIARESITLVRDRASLIPISPGETIPLVWPAEREDALAPLISKCPNLKPYLIPLGASFGEVDDLVRLLETSPLVLVGTENLGQHPAWADLIHELAGQSQLAVIAISSPYDLLIVPDTGTYLCTYSDHMDSMEALGRVLNGSLAPGGRLPVDLPGLE